MRALLSSILETTAYYVSDAARKLVGAEEEETFDAKDVKDLGKLENYMKRVPHEGRERVVAVSREGRLFSLDWSLLMTAANYRQLDSARMILRYRPRSRSYINSQKWKASDFAMDLGNGSSPALLALLVSTLSPPSQGPSMEVERVLAFLIALKRMKVELPLNVLMTIAADCSRAYSCETARPQPSRRRRRGNFG